MRKIISEQTTGIWNNSVAELFRTQGTKSHFKPPSYQLVNWKWINRLCGIFFPQSPGPIQICPTKLPYSSIFLEHHFVVTPPFPKDMWFMFSGTQELDVAHFYTAPAAEGRASESWRLNEAGRLGSMPSSTFVSVQSSPQALNRHHSAAEIVVKNNCFTDVTLFGYI